MGRHFGPKGAEPISYQDMLAWSQITDRKLTAFDIASIRRLDGRYFYVMRTPNGAAPQFLDDAAMEKQVASAFRAMIARGKEQKKKETGLAELPKPKPIATVPVISRMAAKK